MYTEIIPNTTKECRTCKKIKLLSDYYFRQDTKKYRTECNSCKNTRTNQYYKKYYELNKEKILAKNKEWRIDHKDEMLSWGRDHYRRNPNKHIIKSTLWRKNNPKKHKTSRDIRNNREYVKISHVNASAKRRSIKIQTSDNTIPTEVRYPMVKELQELMELQDHKCNNCRCDITERKHLDHYYPLSKGGQHSISNVQFLCPECNLKKGDKIPNTLMLV